MKHVFKTNIVCNNCKNSVSSAFEKEIIKKTGYKIIASKQDFWHDKVIWRKSMKNTLNCLIGCSIGDLGVFIYTLIYYPEMSQMFRMGLAITAGLITSISLETIVLKIKHQFEWKSAFDTALKMSFISMVFMELVMNFTDFVLVQDLNHTSLTFWLAIIPSLILGYLAPLPYNYYKLKKFNKACH